MPRTRRVNIIGKEVPMAVGDVESATKLKLKSEMLRKNGGLPMPETPDAGGFWTAIRPSGFLQVQRGRDEQANAQKKLRTFH